MNIKIRHENKSEYRIVENIAREAFWNLYFPGCDEHLIVNKIRKSPDFIKELSFIIEVNDEIAGAIFYTHSKIVSKDNIEYPTISFGPVFILPKYHRQGLGRMLISHSIEKAKELGYKAILTLGYEYHYSPYGFIGGKNYNISMPDGNFYKGLLVLPLYEGALNNISGSLYLSDIFEVTEEEIADFDSTFPYKEKKIQPSQKEFEIAASMLDN